MDILRSETIAAAVGYNEAEVRFHIIDPILRQLGYPDSEGVYIKLEEKLDYPYVHVGRRSKKDLPIGFPDYRVGLMGARGSFIVEAKSGSASLSDLEIEQAHSYAAHSQVGANYFVLCNGIEFRVYETLSGPNANSICSISLVELNKRFHELENILTPAILEKNCKIFYDNKLKIFDGIGSSIKLVYGEYRIIDYSYRIFIEGNDVTEFLKKSVPQVKELDSRLEFLRTEFQLRMEKGRLERQDDGSIIASSRFPGVTKNNTEMMKIIGIDQISVVTRDEFLSRDSGSPSIFEATQTFFLPKGAMVGELFGSMAPSGIEISGEVFVRAGLFATDKDVRGEYLALSKYQSVMPMGIPFQLELDLVGAVEMTFED